MMAQTHPTSLLDPPVATLARLQCHGREKDEKERKRLEKLQPRVLALYSKVDLLLACDKPIFELPIQEWLKLHSRELETWVQLVKIPLSNEHSLMLSSVPSRHQSHPARPDPLTTNELVNELRQVSRLRP